MDNIRLITQSLARSELKKVAKERWQTFTLAEQLGNIESEVGRAMRWKEKGNAEQTERAGARALELFDCTLDDPRWKTRYKEIARAREVVCDFLYGENEYGGDREGLEKYFMAFAIMARR